MRHTTFVGFIWPSAFVMILFIAVPIISVGIQSLFIQHEQVIETVENCGPFGCKQTQQINHEATKTLREEKPLGRFVGLQAYTNRNHLAIQELKESWGKSKNFIGFFKDLMNLPFYKALVFTITYTAFVTPMVLVLGFFVALSVNRLPSYFKGPTIFCSLLPFIVTPLLGALILFWMIDADGIIGGTLQIIFDNPELSLKASPSLTWITLIIYGIWHSAPFSFIVFYAGLQTVPKETIESAKIDGANKWEQVRYVMIPHLMPLVIFIALMQLMDNFRVFEPIVGFNASANATSLSWLIYNDLRGSDGNMVFGSAAATSFLMIIGVCILLTPVLIRTWRSYQNNP